MGSQQKCVKFDEIKKMLNLPELAGVQFNSNFFRGQSDMFKYTLPEIALPEFDPSGIPEEVLRSSLMASGSGDTWKISSTSVLNGSAPPYIPKDTYVDLLSGYDEYLRDFCANDQTGILRVTPQGTLSLSLGHSLQVDLSLNGAIRVVNPKAHIAMAVNGEGSASVVMHPLGRLHHEGDTALLMTFDEHRKMHKFAKLWPDKSVFKSCDMTYAYVMDSAGTRTTFSPLPLVASSDISLPVFYNTSPHGAECKDDADRLRDAATHTLDSQGNVVWNVNDTTIKYLNGELRLMRPPNTHLRTSAVTGCLAFTTDKVHCTATQSHFFVKYAENKMHYDGVNFKIRTAGQAAGFDENNLICLY